MTSVKYITIGKFTALVSFLIGALIFGFYFFTSKGELLFVGYGYIVFAGIVNLIVILFILVKAITDLSNRKNLLKTSGIMLINIPIMFFFIWVAMILTGTMRIKFTNATQNKLTDINIVGCESKHIDELKPNESKTIWVGITGDCSINLEYLENGKLKRETVVGYATTGGGQKLKHKIDGVDKDIL